MNENIQKYIEDIIEEIMNKIIQNLCEEKISLGEAKYVAKDFLALLPVSDREDALDKLYHLIQVYPQIRSVFTKYFNTFMKEKTATTLQAMRSYMEQGKYEEALLTAKGG